jgi:hypothetical protein
MLFVDFEVPANNIFQDGLFDRMSLSDWNAATRPKIQGSWNLHNVLPTDLNFFIFISSLCGIVGKETTANYAAGNSYMDSLARYRVSTGQKAISLDLGLMEEVGLLAADSALMASAKSTGVFTPLVPLHLFGALDHYCNPSLPIPAPDKSQLLIGIAPPEDLRIQNLEPASWMYRPPFAHMFNLPASDGDIADRSTSDPSTSPIINLATALAQVNTLKEAGALITKALMSKFASAVGAKEEDLEASKALRDYGVDSLVAVELRNWFAQKVKADLSVFDIMGDTTFMRVGDLAASRSAYKQARWDQ